MPVELASALNKYIDARGGGEGERPYLAIALEFDVHAMRAVMEQLDNPPRPSDAVGPGIFVDEITSPVRSGSRSWPRRHG